MNYNQIKRPFSTKILMISVAVGLIGVAGCSPTRVQRGHIVEEQKIEQIRVGETSKNDILRLLGSPTTTSTFDENTWYYIGSVTEKQGFMDRKVLERDVLELQFDNNNTLLAMRKIDNQGMDNIPIVDDKTPTAGHDLTILQQLLGNIGRFNTPGTDEPVDPGSGTNN